MSKKKASAKEPFLPFFVGDFSAATAEWEGEAKSLYLTLLTHQWALGSIPAVPSRICKLVGWDWHLFDEHWRTARRKFIPITVEIDGEPQERLVNPRLEEHRAKTQQLSGKNAQAGKKGAAARWQKDGERHDDDMANAINKSGERHQSANSESGEKDSSRHHSANGARHPKIDGAADGNPSHPIPSHPTLDISQQDLSGAALTAKEPHRAADLLPVEPPDGIDPASAGGETPRETATPPVTPAASQVGSTASPPKPTPTPAGAMAVTLRDARVSVTSDDPTLLGWIRDSITTEQLLEAVGVAKLRKPNEIIYAKYLDPIVRELRAKASAPAPSKPRETPAEREWRLLRADAASSGYHREPRPDETAAQYRAAFQKFEKERAAESLARINAGGGLKAMKS